MDSMKVSAIYIIKSIINSKRVYIGSAVNVAHRWECHLSDLRLNKHHSKKLQRHYNKYGLADLNFSILLGCDKEDLVKTEQYFLDTYKPYFNVHISARSPLGLKRSKEACNNMSKAQMGHIPWNKGIKTGIKPTNAFQKGSKAWAEGRTFTKEHKQNLRKAKINCNLSQSHKDSLSKALTKYWVNKRLNKSA